MTLLPIILFFSFAWLGLCRISFGVLIGRPQDLAAALAWAGLWAGIGWYIHSPVMMGLALVLYAPLMTILWLMALWYHQDNAKAVAQMAQERRPCSWRRKEPHL